MNLRQGRGEMCEYSPANGQQLRKWLHQENEDFVAHLDISLWDIEMLSYLQLWHIVG